MPRCPSASKVRLPASLLARFHVGAPCWDPRRTRREPNAGSPSSGCTQRRGIAIHPGVRRVLRHLHEPRAELDNVSLKTLAGIASLSPSRFMHAFTESVGVPVRPYLLWLRLQRAACDLMDGTSVTNAAHRAGFSDAAHLTRTFRRMLGATPSDLALLKRLSLGFSLEATDRPDRAIHGAA